MSKESTSKFKWQYVLLVFIILAAINKFMNKDEKTPTKASTVTKETQAVAPAEVQNEPVAEVKSFKILEPESLILTGEELGNYKLDEEWSGKTHNSIRNSYKKKLDGYTESHVVLKVSVFDDSLAAYSQLHEDIKSYFSKTKPDGKGGVKKNNFYSKQIPIEKFGDTSFCYSFVSPTVEVLFKNYLIEADATKVYPYENISESNSATINKAIKIAKQQIEKIKIMTGYQ